MTASRFAGRHQRPKFAFEVKFWTPDDFKKYDRAHPESAVVDTSPESGWVWVESSKHDSPVGPFVSAHQAYKDAIKFYLKMSG